MADKTNAVGAHTTRKEIRSQIEQRLEIALADWKANLGEKKFKRRIRQVGKLFGKKLKAPNKKSIAPGKKAGLKGKHSDLVEKEFAAK